MAKGSRVRGHKSTAASLRRVANEMQRPVSESSRVALKPILAAAKANLMSNGSYDEGILFRGMQIRQKSKSKSSNVHVVGATGKAIGEAHLVEFGTDPHWQPQRGVMHPGAKAKPFLTPAYADHDQEAVRLFGQALGPAMERLAARNRAKGRT